MSPSRAKKNKRDRMTVKRLSKGRNLAFTILDARRELEVSSMDPKRVSELRGKIESAEKELMQIGFDVEAALVSALQYREFLKNETFAPQPVTSGGVGVYRLGNKPKNWK